MTNDISCEKECLLEKVLETDDGEFNSPIIIEDFADTIDKDTEYLKVEAADEFLEESMPEIIVEELKQRIEQIKELDIKKKQLQWDLLQIDKELKSLLKVGYVDYNKFYGDTKEE